MFLSKSHTQQLKGIAILCVLLIHTLAIIPKIYTTQPLNLLTFFIDQASRVSVPLFLMVSGYGLTKSYEQKKKSLYALLLQRFKALVPSYIFWTFATILILLFTLEWTYPGWPPPLWEQVLLGHADYHLYFVPIILQLYLLFPVLYTCIRKVPQTVLFFFAVQLLTFYYFTQHAFTDGFEYTIVTSWIGYFALGIWLGNNEISKKLAKHLPKWTLLGLIAVSLFSWMKTVQGLDPLFALKFTRFDLLLFTIPASLMFFSKALKPNALLLLAGKYSFLLYLSHTLALRMVYAVANNQLSPKHLAGIASVWLLATIFTIFQTTRK